MKKIKILQIVLSTVSGGMENVIYNIASGFDTEQFEMSVGCFDEIGHLSDKMEKFGVKSRMIPRMPSKTTMVYPGPLIKFIKESGCDIVHTHSGCWYKVAIACAYISGIKLIYTDHGRFFPERRQRIILDRLSVPFTHSVVAVGDDLKNHLISRVGLPAKKIITIRNCIDTERFKPGGDRASVQEEFNYTDENVVIGMIARHVDIKNHRLLIDVFEKIYQKYSHARLMLIGDGQLRIELQEITKSKNLQDVVTFTGDRTDVPRLVSRLDISTLSSLSEGISLTILETMSAGLPVVATDVGGNARIIAEGESGYLVPVSEPDKYIQRLSELIESKDMRSSFGVKARENVVVNWSVTEMINSYQNLYKELLSK